ncbi:MAG: RDD family protein [Candidatus Hodarchaeales archaeon]|jgi:uncharacterized RDD family membrane protein YckC
MASVARVIGVLFGIFFLFISIALLFGGTAVIVVNETLSDSEGFINTPTLPFDNSDVVAIVFESFSINDPNTNIDPDVARWVNIDFNPGDFVTIKVKASNMFIGIAEKSDVDAYLNNVTFLKIDNIGFNEMSYHSENSGLLNNLTSNSPGTQSGFTWIASDESELIWSPEIEDFDKDLSFVLMNPDGSLGLTTSLVAGAQIPFLRAIGIGLLVFGLILLVLAIVFFVIAAKSKGRPQVNRYRIYKDPVAAVVRPEQPNIKFCANCGSQLDLDSKFCSSCGEPVLGEGVPSSKAQGDTPAQQTTPVTAKDLLPKTHPSLPQNAFVVADWGTRFWAWLIDIIIVNMAIEAVRWTLITLTASWGFVTDFTFFSFSILSINGIAMLAYFAYAEGQYGTTLGKQALGLVVVNENGEKTNFGETFVSAIGRAFLLPFDVLIGLFMKDPPNGKNILLNQRLFQRISKTVTVFRPPPGSEPKDFLSSNLLR